MTRQLPVTICVPVYNGRAFVGETLGSIQRQGYKNWTVLISDDRSDDGSAEVCRNFTPDPRFSLCVQPVRLGWIENCNWLLRHADSELVCLVSHDDLLEPDHGSARLHLRRGQVTAFIRVAVELVMSGRPPCPLCGQPLDPSGHVCPRSNGHRHD